MSPALWFLFFCLFVGRQACLGFSPSSGKTLCYRVGNAVKPMPVCSHGQPPKPFRLESWNFVKHQTSLHAESSDSENEEEAAEEAESSAVEEESSETKSILSRVRGVFKGKKKNDEDDGLTFRQKLAKMGLSVVLSYGWVSNMSYSVTVSLAWYIFSKQTGKSPLAPGQWKPFLAVYAGFYVFNNFIRPLRLALSAGVSRYFDNAVNYIEKKAKVSRGVAIFFLVFLANFCGTLAAMSFGITVASTLAGVPIFPPKA